ncbi:MAG: SDR family NAD(P)-dependent oxidoreductase [bacterium]|nr:SDR family NAD(P)-dependent oxidoreductase [bacterium]
MDVHSNMFDLTGKTALVTGGGYGLGRTLVHGLAGHGATVLSVARSGDALAETFSTLGPEHRYIVGDLTDDALYDELDRMPEHIDILVNNAGGDPFIKPWPEQTPEEWRGTYEVNVVAAVRLIHLLSPKMAERGFGRIINVSSIYGSIGQDARNTTRRGGAGAYTAAKHGLIGLTHYLACQLGRTGVTVNTLSPGMITWHPDPSAEARELWEKLADQTPVGRNSLPHDYVTAVVFLAAEGSAFVNGTNLVVDGGWSIW